MKRAARATHAQLSEPSDLRRRPAKKAKWIGRVLFTCIFCSLLFLVYTVLNNGPRALPRQPGASAPATATTLRRVADAGHVAAAAGGAQATPTAIGGRINPEISQRVDVGGNGGRIEDFESLDEVLGLIRARNGRVLYFLQIDDKMLTDVALCAIESTTRVSTDLHILLLSNAATPLPQWLLDAHPPSRLHRLHFNLSSIFEGTPLRQWYHDTGTGKRKDLFPKNNLSNAMRLALLWKAGGCYLDLDMALFRGIDPAVHNGPARQDSWRINNAIMAFWEAQSEFLLDVMNEFEATFNGEIWGHNGPDMLTRTWRKKNWKDREMPIIPKRDFQMIEWTQVYHDKIFQKPLSDEAAKANWDDMTKNAYGIHMYNALIKGHYGRFERDSLLGKVFERTCPLTWDHASTVFRKA